MQALQHSSQQNELPYPNKHKIATTPYETTPNLVCHEAGQGSGNGGTNWIFISIPMIEVVEDQAPRCDIEFPKETMNRSMYMIGFADDKRHYVNGFINVSKNS